MKTISFVSTNLNFNKIHYEVLRKIQEKGYNVSVITNSKLINKYYRKKNIDVIYIEPQSGMENIDEYEMKYNFVFEGYFFREIKLYKKNISKLKKSISGYLKFFENLNKEDLYIVNNGEGVLNICAWLYCKKTNTNFLQNEWVGVSPGKRMICKDILKQRWIKREFYDKELSEKELGDVNDFLSYSKEKKKLIGFGKLPIVSSNNFKKFIKLFLSYHKDKKLKNEIPSPAFYLHLYLRRIINKNQAKKYYRLFDSTKKYFYFPLHEVYDSAVLINHYKFFYQNNIIKNISKALPEGYLLYIKEHPVTIGTTPIKWYKELSKLKNVVILLPTINSHDIVKNSEGIITICSTTGYEALQYQKPVITLADPFYGMDNLTINVNNFEDVNEVEIKIKEAIGKKVDINKVKRLINSVLKSQYDGTYYIYQTQFDYSDEAIERIANSTIKACEYKGEII